MGQSSSKTGEASLPVSAVGAAHDLRNVLFVISAHCHRLLQSTQPGDSGLDDLHAIKDATERGMALARQMVSTTSPEAPPRPVDVNEVIVGIEPLLRRLVGEPIDVVIRLSSGAWPVQVTTTQIEQVIMNLAVNARDAMPDGGRLSIVTENRCVPTAGSAAASHFLVISVIDTGIGMDADLQARIFEPYFTTKRDAGGTGIGLGTVRSIATMSGGQVEVSSASGEGTTMRVVLPRAEMCLPDPQAVSAPTTTTPAREPIAQKRVLIVEDEEVVRDLLQRWLALLGHDAVVAANGSEALELCGSDQPPVDLVLTDLHLPDVGGPSIARSLHDLRPDVPIVFMSGESEKLRRLERQDRAAVLTKPFSLAELTQAVSAAFGGGTGRAAQASDLPGVVALAPRARPKA
jgi:two-component system cell cycle sensor histidine kinase/response regulator CckA